MATWDKLIHDFTIQHGLAAGHSVDNKKDAHLACAIDTLACAGAASWPRIFSGWVASRMSPTDETDKNGLPGSQEDARAIAQGLLAATGEALRAGDFVAFRNCFRLPQTVQTFNGSSVIETEDDLRQIFDRVRDHFARIGVTELVRHVVNVDFRDADTILSTHESRLLGGNELLETPYPVFSILHRTETGWVIGDSNYAIPDEDGHEQAIGTNWPPFLEPD